MSMKNLIVLAAVSTVIGFSNSAVPSYPQRAQRTVLDGVYTEAQAKRGEALVIRVGCADCHGGSLEGGAAETPSLVGDAFISGWNGLTLDDLSTKLTTMPPDNTTKMRPQEYVDIMTLLLRINGYPAGKDELVANPEVLRQIKIVP